MDFSNKKPINNYLLEELGLKSLLLTPELQAFVNEKSAFRHVNANLPFLPRNSGVLLC